MSTCGTSLSAEVACGLLAGIPIQGSVSGPGCGCLTPTNERLFPSFEDLFCSTADDWLSNILSGFDPANGYLVGPIPIDGIDLGTRRLLIYCDGSALQVAVLDANNCIDASVSASWSTAFNCADLTGVIGISHPAAEPCGSGACTMQVVLSP